jgi:hypothetical protein
LGPNVIICMWIYIYNYIKTYLSIYLFVYLSTYRRYACVHGMYACISVNSMSSAYGRIYLLSFK